MEKTIRTLQVESLGWQSAHAGRPLFPRIRVTGHWLKRAGFPPGSRVTVQIEAPGRIVLVAITGGT